jgi:glutaredoxin 2
LDKSRNSNLENYISFTQVEKQWESHSALKVDKLVTPLLRKMDLECFGTPTGALFFVYTYSASFTPS